jgi:DNA-binding NtrC family response regulator
MKYKVLIVEDDPLVNELLTETVQRAGYDCTTTTSGEDGVARFQDSPTDIVLTDLKMAEMDGIGVLEQVRKVSPDVIVVIMTAYGTVETAVKAIKKGAYDFLLKPVLPETVEHVLGRVTEILDLRLENEQLKKDLSARYQNMIGKSKIMRDIFDKVSSIADARSTVLLTGPSGTGKEMVARAIHMTSARRNGPFVKLNCAAIPETLVEAELFGYEKGAFTDAKKTNHGRFELADGGTLLLDEISEMPLNLQSKLLRVIQEREFERVGSSQTIKVDVRIVATSNRNLKDYIAAGRFREDLFYRLNVIPIHLPSLSERPEDIPLLVDHFIDKYNHENHKAVKGVTPGSMRVFLKYPWPGNVRELENLIERAVVTSRADYLTEDDFPAELAYGDVPSETVAFKDPMTLAEANKILILKALERAGGNKTRAAEALDITARTIRNKLQEYGIKE